MKIRVAILIFLISFTGFSPTSFAFAQSAQSSNLSQFLGWAKEHEITLIRTTYKTLNDSMGKIWNPVTDEMPLATMAGIDQLFEALKKIPPHLIGLLQGQTIFFIDDCAMSSPVHGYGSFIKLSQKYQMKPVDLSREAVEEIIVRIPKGILDWEGTVVPPTGKNYNFFNPDTDGNIVFPVDLMLCGGGPGPLIHEFGHVVDFSGLRMYKGRNFAFGKTDEEIRELYNEYKRIFQVPEEYTQAHWKNTLTEPPPGFISIYAALDLEEDFADHFSAYILQPQHFRERAAKEPLLAEKYEFSKTKIFLGKEYSTEDQSKIKTEAIKPEQKSEQKPEAKEGIASNQKTKPKFIKTLRRGMKDDEVKILQEFLKTPPAGGPDVYPEGLATGYFGPLTEAAVKRFQVKYGIESIGIVGPKTRQKLNELLLMKPTPAPISQEEKEKKEVSPTPTPDIAKPTTPSEKPTPSLPLTPQFQSGPSATWPEWLKQEREKNIEDVQKMEELAQQTGFWKSLCNAKLPQFIEWAKEHEIKLIGTRHSTYISNNIWNSAVDEMSLTAVLGIDIKFEDLKKMPPHLINLLRGQAVFFSSEDCRSYAGSYWRQVKLSQEYQKKFSDLPIDIKISGCVSIPENLFGSATCEFPYDIFICKWGNFITTHEFGHIVDFNGIRMYKGREFALGKTDEEIRELYNEYKRVFQMTEEQRNWTDTTKTPPGVLWNFGNLALTENFAVHFDDYVNRPQNFREKAVKDPGLAEKYEFLKTKIFLGQEYQGSPPNGYTVVDQLNQCQIKN